MYYYLPSPGIINTMYYLNNHMYYVESIAELTRIFSSTEHQSAGNYRRRCQIPMNGQIDRNLHKRHWYAPIGILNATTTVLCNGPTNRTTSELEYVFIGKTPVNVFSPLVKSVQHKLNSH